MAITFIFSRDGEIFRPEEDLPPHDPIRCLATQAFDIEPAISKALIAVGLDSLNPTIEINFSGEPTKIRFYVIRVGALPREGGKRLFPQTPGRYIRFIAANVFEALIEDGGLSEKDCQLAARAADTFFAAEAKKLLIGATVVDVLPEGTLMLSSGVTSIAISSVGLDWEGEEDVNTYLFITSLNPDSVLIAGGFEAVIRNDWPTNMLP